ncbi:MAG: ATP-binding protein [Spirochaetales bacterium]|nr:ATP-binding protein [Candidatus Physcosoma equi]
MLERVYREEAEKGERNIVFLKAPTRTGSTGPVFVPAYPVAKEPRAKEVLYRMLSTELGPHLASEEIPLLLLSAYERGVLGEGTLLIIDELDAGLHPSSEIALLSSLEYLSGLLGLTVVVSTESLVVLRGSEEMLCHVRYYQTQYGITKDVTTDTEALYQDLTRGIISL